MKKYEIKYQYELGKVRSLGTIEARNVIEAMKKAAKAVEAVEGGDVSKVSVFEI